MNALTQRLLLVAVSAFLVVGCEGDDGTNGAAGATGADGADGADGTSGVACWDLNQNGTADADEDLNGDGNVDVLDCREPLPGTAIKVSGKASTPAGPLDRFTAVMFTPAGGGDGIAAEVANDGSYIVELGEGDYTALASRPGYEDVSAALSVTQAGPNMLDFSLPEIPDGEYITSEQCGICHTIEYASFKQTGHPFKLNKVVNNEQPIYPFTNLNGVLERIMDDGVGVDDSNGTLTDNPLGTPVTWADVSYVIGGYFWKARFVDQNGSIVTGTEVQYNFKNDSMTAYHNNEADKNYNCGNCHTTGWVHTEPGELGQDDLEFMQGTFSEGGVHCEACHAAGAKHAKFRGGIVRNAVPRTFIELTADGTGSMPKAGFGLAVACGECHTRDGERDYSSYKSGFDNALAAAGAPDPRPNEMGGRIAASGGLIKHHEQYDEILGIDPDTLDTVRSPEFLSAHGNCGNCHNPHGSSVNVNNPGYTGMPGVDPTNGGCVTCHGDYDPQLRAGPGMRGLNCSDCHMPDLAKSAIVQIAAEADRPAQGDVRTHIFSIALDSTQEQFIGGFAYPAIDEDWACRTCHNSSSTGVIFPVGDAFIDAYTFHDNIVD